MTMAWNSRRDEEESIFKKKLLYDGHGTGEDRRLVTLLKNITKLCLGDESSEDSVKLVNIISKDLTTAINSAERNEKVSQMCDRTLENLEQLIEQHSHRIEELKSDLSSLELELEFSERLVKVNSHPNCIRTLKSMQAIEKKRESLMVRIEREKSMLQTLIEACRNLEKVLNDMESTDATTKQ